MDISDIMIYFNDRMKQGQRNTVEETLRDIDGVIAPRFVTNKEQFLIIAYNPEKVQTSRFQETFAHMDLDARFVGM